MCHLYTYNYNIMFLKSNSTKDVESMFSISIIAFMIRGTVYTNQMRLSTEERGSFGNVAL